MAKYDKRNKFMVPQKYSNKFDISFGLQYL